MKAGWITEGSYEGKSGEVTEGAQRYNAGGQMRAGTKRTGQQDTDS